MNQTKLSDQQLVEQIRSGDREAFRLLVERYKDRVFNTIFRMLGNLDDAEDVLQEVFVRVYKALDGFRDQSSFSTWIYRVTVNHCMTALRRKGTV